MATNRTKRTRVHKPALTAAQLAYVSDSEIEGGHDFSDFELSALKAGRFRVGTRGGRDPQALWEEYRERYLAKYILHHPGKRPFAWWQWDAPELRKRLSGIGDPSHEHLSIKSNFAYGLPASSWITIFDMGYYENFKGRAPVLDDMPTYESQATYLKRHNLLTERELEETLDFTPTTLIQVTRTYERPATAYQGPRSEEYKEYQWANL